MNCKNIKTVLGVIILLLSVGVGLIGLYGQNNTDNVTPVSSSSKSEKTNDSNNNNTTNETNSNSSNTNKTQKATKTEDPKSKILVSLGGADNHTAGLTKIRVYVTNNSSRNIKYIEVNIFEKNNGSIIKSDWTNDGSLIKAGAKQTIDTYFDFEQATSTLEVELRDVIFE